MEDLIDHSDGEFFASAVTKKVAPDYFEFVKKPMDLNKINNNLRQMKYMCNQEVIADIEQMFENCFLYNETETEVYKAGIRLKKYFEKVAIEFGLMAPEKTKTPMDKGPNMKFEISQREINLPQPLEIEEIRHENDLTSNFEQASGEDIDARAEKSHPQASMNENFTILKNSQPEKIHPQPSEIVENRPEQDLPSNFEQVTGEFDLMSTEKSPSKNESTYHEYELPYGWKKIVSRKHGYNRVTILSPTGECFDRREKIKKFVKKHPEIEYDAKSTNFSLPNDLRKSMPPKIEENYREYDLPFGWKKVAHKTKYRAGEWHISIRSPNGKKCQNFNDIEKFVLKHPEMKYDAKLTNFSKPLELRKTMKKYDPSKQEQEPPKKPMDETAIPKISQPEINHSQPSEIEVNRHEHDLTSNFEQVSEEFDLMSLETKSLQEDIDARAEKSHPQTSMNENLTILKKPLLVLEDVTKNSLYSTNGTSTTTLGKSIYQKTF